MKRFINAIDALSGIGGWLAAGFMSIALLLALAEIATRSFPGPDSLHRRRVLRLSHGPDDINRPGLYTAGTGAYPDDVSRPCAEGPDKNNL